MEHYAGINVSLERSSVCVVDALGKIVKEAKISSDPAALVEDGWKIDLNGRSISAREHSLAIISSASRSSAAACTRGAARKWGKGTHSRSV